MLNPTPVQSRYITHRVPLCPVKVAEHVRYAIGRTHRTQALRATVDVLKARQALVSSEERFALFLRARHAELVQECVQARVSLHAWA